MKSLWLEFKSLSRSIKFLALLLVILGYQILFFIQLDGDIVAVENQEVFSAQSYQRKCENWLRYWQSQFDENNSAGMGSRYPQPMIEANLQWYEKEAALAASIATSFQRQDWSQYTRDKCQKNLLEWEIRDALGDKSNPYASIVMPDQYFGGRWEQLKETINLLEMGSLPYAVLEGRHLPRVETIAFTADYFYQLHERGLAPAEYCGQLPWTFCFNFLRNGLPNALAIIAVFIAVGLLPREKRLGVVKVSLQSPASRAVYLFRKTILGCFSTLALVTVPQLLAFLSLGAVKGFKGINFPVLLNNNVFEWQVSKDYAYLVRWSYSSSVGLSHYTGGAYGGGALDNMGYVPLWQFLGLALLGLTLFILFCTVLGLLISIIFKNETVAQVVATGVLAFGILFGSILPRYQATVWDLFSKAHIVSLLEGSHFSTYLSSMVVLGIASVIIFIVAAFLLRKQDIAV